MALKEHPEYSEEKNRLEYTIKYVESSIDAADNNRKHFREDMRQAFVDLDPTDSSLSYSKIMLTGKFLDTLEKNYDGLIKAKKKPYFCRIDLKSEGDNKVDKIYIGKTSLSRIEDDVPLIVDWRAPIASVYYDGRLGEVKYETPKGKEKGELKLKRQYTINEGNLENIMDVDITTTDTFLQAALGENKDNRLKDIVSTIQIEQNEIIRADIDSPLIVQGAAGSGKTTIALHRIAYLIYTYEKTFDPDNFLIIAPNRLFLNYISEVLPELGVEQVVQTTYVDLVKDLSKIKHKLLDTNEKIERFIKTDNNNDEDNEIEHLMSMSEFKGSLNFKELIDNYIDKVENEFCIDADFSINEYVIYSIDEIKKMLLVDFSYLPIYKRIDELKKALRNKLKRDKAKIIKKIEEYYDIRIENIRDRMPANEERRLKLIEIMDERDNKLNSIKKAAKTAVKKYISLFPKKDVIYYYKDFMENIKNKYDTLSMYTSQHTINLLSKKKIEYEDLTPLLYLKYKIFGFDKEMKIKYMVIDEAQDFSLFQLYTLKKIFNTELFTILGDLAQGIHSYRGIKNWQDVLDNVFESRKKKYLTLEKSYRTTIEIMDAANEILKMVDISKTVIAKPVVRHGNKPKVLKFQTKKEISDAIIKRINELKKRGYNTIAVIGKTEDECKKIRRMIYKKGETNIKQITSKDMSYEGGTVIVPSYLAKGLEFDAVIIALVGKDYYETELDLKLLYVAMTRALHSMDIICLNDNMKFLKKVDENKFIY